jgi:hypothetical protein
MGEATTPTAGDQPTSGTADNSGGNNNNTKDVKPYLRGSQRNCQRAKNRNQKEGNTNTSPYIPKEKFIGRSDDLQGYIYDIIASKGGVAYTRTTEELT